MFIENRFDIPLISKSRSHLATPATNVLLNWVSQRTENVASADPKYWIKKKRDILLI